MNKYIIDAVVEHHPLLSSLKVSPWDEESISSRKERTIWNEVSVKHAHWLGRCGVNWTHRAIAFVVAETEFVDESVAKLHSPSSILLVGSPKEDMDVIGDKLGGVITVSLIVILGNS